MVRKASLTQITSPIQLWFSMKFYTLMGELWALFNQLKCIPVVPSWSIVSPHISMANPNKHTKALWIWTLLYLASKNQVDSSIIQGIVHEDRTSALSTDVFLNASTASTLAIGKV